jgi:hypothetical protein
MIKVEQLSQVEFRVTITGRGEELLHTNYDKDDELIAPESFLRAILAKGLGVDPDEPEPELDDGEDAPF